MNGVPVTGELLNPQTFSNTNVNVLPDEVPKGQTAVQNDAERLAFAVGSNIEPSSLPRTAPPAETLEKLGRLAFKLGISLIPSSISVTQATIGIVREHEGSSAFFPEFIDLGSGNLATLLNREIQVPNGSKLILIASTDGNGIDIFGVSDGFSGNVGDIDLSNALLVMLDERLQGNLFDSSGQPLTSSLDLSTSPLQVILSRLVLSDQQMPQLTTHPNLSMTLLPLTKTAQQLSTSSLMTAMQTEISSPLPSPPLPAMVLRPSTTMVHLATPAMTSSPISPMQTLTAQIPLPIPSVTTKVRLTLPLH